VVKDFRLAGIRDLIIDVSLRHEIHSDCANPVRNGEASHADSNGALDATVKAKLDNYQNDYNDRNFFFLPAVMTTSGRISGDFLRLLYILSNRQAHNYFTRMGLLDPSTKAFKQRSGTYFYYNRAAIGFGTHHKSFPPHSSRGGRAQLTRAGSCPCGAKRLSHRTVAGAHAFVPRWPSNLSPR
jgi:hypothetical protein